LLKLLLLQLLVLLVLLVLSAVLLLLLRLLLPAPLQGSRLCKTPIIVRGFKTRACERTEPIL
jgi:hypothetical protein